ncbi:MAG: hypothetical protein ACI90V_011798 [Bacillariaceae sp.]|jgi:hypothetical protein
MLITLSKMKTVYCIYSFSRYQLEERIEVYFPIFFPLSNNFIIMNMNTVCVRSLFYVSTMIIKNNRAVSSTLVVVVE